MAAESTSMCSMLHFGKFRMNDVLGDLAPQARGLEHVGLVDGDDLLAPLHGEPAGDARDALDFAGGVAAQIAWRRVGVRVLAPK